VDGVNDKKELAPYETEFDDGFIMNRFSQKPLARGELIYSILDRESYLIRGDHFLPTWDTTDHFHFVCGKCKGVADVLEIRFDPQYGSDVKYALFFYLGCRVCGATGQRKIYLDRRPDLCYCQQTFDKIVSIYTANATSRKSPSVSSWMQ